MTDDWHQRFIEVVEADGRSMRKLSLDAKLGQNYVQQVIKDEKSARMGNVLKVLSEIGSSASLYVVSGIRFTPEDEELLRALAALPEGAKPAALQFFLQLQAGEDHPEPSSSLPD